MQRSLLASPLHTSTTNSNARPSSPLPGRISAKEQQRRMGEGGDGGRLIMMILSKASFISKMTTFLSFFNVFINIYNFFQIMFFPERDSFTLIIRKLCQQIQAQATSLIKKSSSHSIFQSSKASNDPQKAFLDRSIEQLSRTFIQTLTARLPHLITLSEDIADHTEDLTSQLEQSKEKHRKLFSQYQALQLQNDKLKVQVIALSESYEQLSISFQELKFKYHELKQNQQDPRKGTKQPSESNMQYLNLISRDSGTNSASSDRQDLPKVPSHSSETMAYERDLFIEQIRASKKEIFAFRQQVQQLLEERDALKRQNIELEQLLNGEKVRSDRFDREILDILNKNQELKLQILEQKEASLKAIEEKERVEKMLQEQRERITAIMSQKQSLNSQLSQQKTTVSQLKLQTSHLRQTISLLQSRERQFKTRASQSKKQNEQLRVQLQKMILKLQENTTNLQRSKQEQCMRYRHQIQEFRTKTNLLEKQSKSKTNERVQQISKMHKEITSKLQQKIHLLQKGSKQKKEKISQLKFQVERLYESLQIQVEKEFKSAEKVKELTQKTTLLETNLKKTQQILNKKQAQCDKLQQISKGSKYELTKTASKLKKITQFTSKLLSLTLPRIKEELHSLRLLCQHFSSMVQMQKQQTSFLLLKKQEHFKQLIEQSLLQRTLTKEQTALSHSNQIVRWKENCRNYEQRYDQLKANYEILQERYNKLEAVNEDSLKVHAQKQAFYQQQSEKKRVQHASTMRTVQKLKQKCREVEQYYKLVQELSKENLALKNKLQTQTYSHPQPHPSCFSFKSPQKDQLENTSKRQKFTILDDPKYTRTATHLTRQKDEISVNDLTAKAEFQKMRLQAARRQYNAINRQC